MDGSQLPFAGRFAPGTQLLQYELLELLGAGGMGEVYRARDVRLGREVAIKALPARLAEDPEVQRRFEREARAAAALSHPGIVTIYELARVEGQQLVVMELLRGETLRQRTARVQLSWAAAVGLVADMADAVAAAHDVGLVHRDLKPENTFLTTAGVVKILDFGLAIERLPRRSATRQPSDLTESDGTTARWTSEPGRFVGTLGYAAPEQLRGERVDARADLFSLGAMLYELLSGRRAFPGATSADVVAAVLTAPVPPLALSDQEAPVELEALVAGCLQKEAARRTLPARELAAALRALIRRRPGRTRKTPRHGASIVVESRHLDVLVIGSGPAGQRGAIAAAKAGKKVAIVERKGMVGGVSLHRGTIPSKTVREIILQVSGLAQRTFYGRDFSFRPDLSMRDLVSRVDTVIEREQDVVRGQLARNNVTLIEGLASFVDEHTIEIVSDTASQRVQADFVLIATGSRPGRSPAIPIDGVHVFDTDLLPRLEELPRELIVVGASVIGLEFASMVTALNRRVTIIDQRPTILEFADAEVVEALCYQLRRRGATFRLGERVAEVRRDDRDHVVAALESGGSLHGDVLIYAVGRHANTERLNLAAVGIDCDPRGRIAVNAHHQTCVPHIYAAGDVIGFPSLASASMEQGRLAVSHMFGLPGGGTSALLPYGIYTIPELSMVGRTEQQLVHDRVPYEVGVARYEDLAKGQMIGDDGGFLKLLFHADSLRVLGVHIIGTSAAELIHIGQSVMAADGTIEVWRDAPFNHPTLAEAYKLAALNGFNRR